MIFVTTTVTAVPMHRRMTGMSLSNTMDITAKLFIMDILVQTSQVDVYSTVLELEQNLQIIRLIVMEEVFGEFR